MADDNFSPSSYNLWIILVGFGSAALAITIYHCIATRCCNRGQDGPSPLEESRSGAVEMPSSVEISTAHLIPVHKYQTGMNLMGGDGTCAVCLCEFEEGEELRTLPDCKHSYHAPCIDVWLHSHSSCPMCRRLATPSAFPSPSPTQSLSLQPPFSFPSPSSAPSALSLPLQVHQSRMF